MFFCQKLRSVTSDKDRSAFHRVMNLFRIPTYKNWLKWFRPSLTRNPKFNASTQRKNTCAQKTMRVKLHHVIAWRTSKSQRKLRGGSLNSAHTVLYRRYTSHSSTRPLAVVRLNNHLLTLFTYVQDFKQFTLWPSLPMILFTSDVKVEPNGEGTLPFAYWLGNYL